MSFAGIQATVNFYTMQEADLTNQLNTIMTTITAASRNTTDLVQETTQKKDAIYSKANSSESYADSDEYQADLDKVQDGYELKLSTITSWESELETKKQTIETELKATTSYKESFTSALKQNVQSDFKYASSS